MLAGSQGLKSRLEPCPCQQTLQNPCVRIETTAANTSGALEPVAEHVPARPPLGPILWLDTTRTIACTPPFRFETSPRAVSTMSPCSSNTQPATSRASTQPQQIVSVSTHTSRAGTAQTMENIGRPLQSGPETSILGGGVDLARGANKASAGSMLSRWSTVYGTACKNDNAQQLFMRECTSKGLLLRVPTPRPSKWTGGAALRLSCMRHGGIEAIALRASSATGQPCCPFHSARSNPHSNHWW